MFNKIAFLICLPRCDIHTACLVRDVSSWELTETEMMRAVSCISRCLFLFEPIFYSLWFVPVKYGAKHSKSKFQSGNSCVTKELWPRLD